MSDAVRELGFLTVDLAALEAMNPKVFNREKQGGPGSSAHTYVFTDATTLFSSLHLPPEMVSFAYLLAC